MHWFDRSSLSIAHSGSVRGVGVWQVFIFQKHTISEIQAIINICSLSSPSPPSPVPFMDKIRTDLLSSQSPACCVAERVREIRHWRMCVSVCVCVCFCCLHERMGGSNNLQCVKNVCNLCILPSWKSYFMNYIFYLLFLILNLLYFWWVLILFLGIRQLTLFNKWQHNQFGDYILYNNCVHITY